jgi:CBS domain-containing membrane protein
MIADVFDDLVMARMTPAVQTVRADVPLLKAGRIMWAQHVHRLPVVDSQGRVIGIITSSDMVAALVQAADEAESCRM